MMNKKRFFHWNKYNNSWKTKLFIFFMLLIPLCNFAVFTLYANFGGLVSSFRDFSITQNKEVWVGLGNYRRFFEQFELKEYGRIIKTSLGYLPVVLCISLPISVVVSFFLYKKVPCSKLILVCLFLPNIIPLSVIAEYFRQLYDPSFGVLYKLFNKVLGFTPANAPSYLSNPQYANGMLYFYTVWFGFGYNSILLWGAFSRIPQEIIESAELDGANLIKEFFLIDIPVIWPTLSMTIVLSFMTPFTVYMQPLLITFGGQGNTMTIALLALTELRNGFNPYYSATISILIACVSIPLTLFVKWALEKCFTVVEV